MLGENKLPFRNAQLPNKPYATSHNPDECHDKMDSEHACFGPAEDCQRHAVKGMVHDKETSWSVRMKQDMRASPHAGFCTVPQLVFMAADVLDEDEDKSLGGRILSPQNADCHLQALVDKISLLDIA
jgi:hypothetical protein